jgi:hypothetical protein
MKFPITREILQAFDNEKEEEELREEELQQGLGSIIYQLCNEFKQSMPINSKEKRFVWRDFHLLLQVGQNPQNYTSVHRPRPYQVRQNRTIDWYLPKFIDKLKTVFVGCDIIVDPLKTYLIIDWS